MPKPKKTIKKAGDHSYAYCLTGLPASYHSLPFGRQIEHRRTIVDFKKRAERAFADCKGKPTLTGVRAFLKMVEATEFYADWRSDSGCWKDDSVEVWYVK